MATRPGKPRSGDGVQRSGPADVGSHSAAMDLGVPSRRRNGGESRGWCPWSFCPGCLKAAGKTAADLAPGVEIADKDRFFSFTKGRILTLDY
ncbi:MAG: hypothetical protein EA424_25190 [Planctomycetaceae bacterium]|nr:MAG: hypothetical protein EA424_25190 [Planctomycetaceae bacterium]